MAKNTNKIEEEVRLKKRSNFGEVWHRLKKNKLSMVCLGFLAVMICAIVFSTWITPYDYTAQDLMSRFQLPSKAH